MARRARKLVLTRLRTRLLLFTALLAMSEVSALPGSPRLPGTSKKCWFRLLWVLSASALQRAERSRYLSASRQLRYKCRNWHFDVLQRCSDQEYRGYMRMRRATFRHVLGLLRQHASDVFVSRRGAQQLALEI